MLIRRPFLLFTLLAFLFALLAFAYIGHFSRYIADDFCTTYNALSRGVFGSVSYWYNNWAGQYSNWTLKGIIAHLGTGFPGILPALILLLWLGAALWTVTQITSALHLSSARSFSWCVALVAVFAVFAGIPSIVQSLYWFGASIPYTVPLAVLVFYVGLFVRTLYRTPAGRIPVTGLLTALLITLVAGGTSEVFAAVQIAVTGLIVLAALFVIPPDRKRLALWLSVAGLLGSVIALVLIVIAPGTAIRQAEFPDHMGLIEVAVQTVLASASYVVLAVGVLSAIPLLIAIIFPAVAVLQFVPPDVPVRLRPGQASRLLALSAAVAFILLMASLAPPIYAASSTPPARVYFFPQAILVCMACFWGVVMGLSLRPRYTHPNRLITALLTLLLLVGPLLTAVQALATAPQFSAYAAEWDARDQAIRAAVAGGVSHVEVKTLTVDIGSIAALETIGADSSNWVNQCAANYYGAATLTARTALQMGDKSS